MPRQALSVKPDPILRNGNVKLGQGIGKVSLPPIITCPGALTCQKACYAVRLERIYKSYAAMNARHLETLTNSPEEYFAQIARDIAYNGYEIVRIHESGDFFLLTQIEGWVSLVRAHPNVRFFGYTRSWKVPELRAALEVLRAQPNVQLFASVERRSAQSGP